MLRTKNLKDSRFFTGIQAMKNNRYFYRVLLAIVTFAVFWQVIGHEFVWYDDPLLIYENPHMQSFTVQNILHFWKNPDYGNLYIPVTQTFWAIQAVFARTSESDSNKIKLNPAVFHITNLIFHMVNALLVFLILRLVVKDELACFLGALLFAIHPVQVESVAWATGFKDVLSGFFSLVAIWQYLLYAQLSKISPEGNGSERDRVHENNKGKTVHYLIAVFSFLLAMLSKPVRVIVPIAAFALDYFIVKRRIRDIVASLMGFMAIALPIMGLTIVLTRSNVRAASSLSFLERLLVVSDSLVFYLYKLIVPISLGPDYGRTPKFVLSQNWIYFAWIIPVLLLIAIYIMKKHRAWLLASAGIFIAGVLPLLGFIRFNFQRMSTVADRYLYLSMLGPGMALAFFLSGDILSVGRKRVILAMCGVVLGILGVISIRQTTYWENSITFFKHAIQVNPGSHDFHVNLGIVLAQQGKFNEAVFHSTEALKIEPNDVGAHNNLGNALVQQEKFHEAAFHYAQVLKFMPDNAEVHSKLGYALARMGKYDEAVYNLREALRLSPNDAGAHINLGIVMAMQGNVDKAIFHFSEALKIDPGDKDAYANLIKAQSLKK